MNTTDTYERLILLIILLVMAALFYQGLKITITESLNKVDQVVRVQKVGL